MKYAKKNIDECNTLIKFDTKVSIIKFHHIYKTYIILEKTQVLIKCIATCGMQPSSS